MGGANKGNNSCKHATRLIVVGVGEGRGGGEGGEGREGRGGEQRLWLPAQCSPLVAV